MAKQEFYCLVERKRVQAEPTGVNTAENGRRFAKAICPSCGRKLSRALPNK